MSCLCHQQLSEGKVLFLSKRKMFGHRARRQSILGRKNDAGVKWEKQSFEFKIFIWQGVPRSPS